MTRRDKVIVLSASLLAVCVIASALVLYVRTGKSGSIDTEALMISCCTVLAGIGSVLLVFYAKVRRRAHEKLLNDDYYHKYEIVRDAVMSSQLSAGMKREIKNDVIDLLLSAQRSGKAADSAVGDPTAFSKEIIGSSLKPGNMIVLSLLDAGIAFISFVVGVNTLLWLEHTGNSFFGVGIGVNMVVLFALIALLVIPAARRLVRSGSTWAFMIPIASGILFILLTEILRKYFYATGWVKTFLDGTLAMIPNAAVFTVYLVLIPLLAGLKAWLRKTVYR